MELRHLKYFMRAAEMSHFTKAAESLYISQPSLSVHIQQLEEELKTKLFARVGRNVRLTESGQILLKHAARAVKEIESAGQEIDATTGLLQGTLSIASLPLFASKYLPKIVHDFSLLHPHVRIKLKSGQSDDIEQELIDGSVDIGLSLLPAEHPEINTKELLTGQSVMLLSASHPLAKKKKLEPSDFESLPMAFPSHKISSSRPLAGYFEAIGVKPNVVVEQDDGHGLMSLVKFGNFVTFLPKYVAGEAPDLVYLSLPPPGITLSMGALWTQLSPAAAAFMELVNAAEWVK